ncbi:hypothetical protein PG985_003160 [Apiospora marii]|uniref:uncharacterized protein n=1 Tax=Apiospora marii TaxID=335849 RepID=UPI003132300D
MSSTSDLRNAHIRGASHRNFSNMKHHISELQDCANAYFRDIQLEMRTRDYEFELRLIDWNYTKCALERITKDFSDRLDARAQRADIIPADNLWNTLEHKYSKHDSDWQQTAPRTMVRDSRTRNYVQSVGQDEALWYQPSSNFDSPAKLMAERPKQISPAPAKIPGVKNNAPKNNAPMNNAAKSKTSAGNTPKAVNSQTIVTPVSGTTSAKAEQPKSSNSVPPHLRGSQKKTPATVKQLVTPESSDKTPAKPKPKPKPGAWVPPHLRGAPSKETRITNTAAVPEKGKEEKLPPHLRSGSDKGPKVTHQRQAPVTPPAAAASSDTASDANSPVSSSESSSASNVLIDISDSPATVFDSSARNKETHGTTDVWAALQQLTNVGLLAATSVTCNETCDLLLL